MQCAIERSGERQADERRASKGREQRGQEGAQEFQERPCHGEIHERLASHSRARQHQREQHQAEDFAPREDGFGRHERAGAHAPHARPRPSRRAAEGQEDAERVRRGAGGGGVLRQDGARDQAQRAEQAREGARQPGRAAGARRLVGRGVQPADVAEHVAPAELRPHPVRAAAAPRHRGRDPRQVRRRVDRDHRAHVRHDVLHLHDRGAGRRRVREAHGDGGRARPGSHRGHRGELHPQELRDDDQGAAAAHAGAHQGGRPGAVQDVRRLPERAKGQAGHRLHDGPDREAREGAAVRADRHQAGDPDALAVPDAARDHAGGPRRAAHGRRLQGVREDHEPGAAVQQLDAGEDAVQVALRPRADEALDAAHALGDLVHPRLAVAPRARAPPHEVHASRHVPRAGEQLHGADEHLRGAELRADHAPRELDRRGQGAGPQGVPRVDGGHGDRHHVPQALPREDQGAARRREVRPPLPRVPPHRHRVHRGRQPEHRHRRRRHGARQRQEEGAAVQGHPRDPRVPSHPAAVHREPGNHRHARDRPGAGVDGGRVQRGDLRLVESRRREVRPPPRLYFGAYRRLPERIPFSPCHSRERGRKVIK